MRKSAACKTSKQRRIIERLAAKNDNNARTAHIIPTCFLCRFCDYCRFFVRCCLKKHLNLLAVVVVFVGCCFGLKFYILVWWDCALYLALSLACHASVGILLQGAYILLHVLFTGRTKQRKFLYFTINTSCKIE